MVIIKDIDGIHRVVDSETLFLHFQENVTTYLGLSTDEIYRLKQLKELFNLKDEEDIDNFIYDHTHCHAE